MVYVHCVFWYVLQTKIVELYAAAAEHYPKNAEILTHLFMSYVRVGDCQKQQQVGGW